MTTGLTINVTFDASVTSATNASQIEAGVNAEVAVLQALIATPLTLNLAVGWGEVGGASLNGALGAASPVTLVSAQTSDVQPAYLGRALQPREFYFPTGGFHQIQMSDAQKIALNIAANVPLSGSVGFDNTVSWDFGSGSTIAQDAFDFSGVFAGAVTKLLGRTPSSPDLFRYDAPNVFASGDAGYFSVDDGYTIGPRYVSATTDDWAQGSSGPDAFTNARENVHAPLTGIRLPITQVDLQTLRAIGLNLNVTTDFTSAINAEFQSFLGRGPTTAEFQTWKTYVYDGADVGTLGLILSEGTEFQARAATVYDTTYNYFGSRLGLNFAQADPDRAVVQTALANGESVSQIRADAANSAAGQVYINQTVNNLYDLFFGRDATANELAVWRGSLAGGGGFDTVRTALTGSPEGQGHTAAEVTALYQTYFGRAPTAAELSVWQANVSGADNPGHGLDFDGVYSALVNSAEGISHTAAAVKLIYETYMGRDPATDEIATWQKNFVDNAGSPILDATAFNVAAQTNLGGVQSIGDTRLLHEIDAVRSAVVFSYSGQFFLINQIRAINSEFLGASTPDTEQAALSAMAGGETPAQFRTSVINSAAGVAFSNSQIIETYEVRFGRDPSAAELAVWHTSLLAGQGYDTVFYTLLASPEGQAHSISLTTQLYETYFGRDPTLAELNVWLHLFQENDDFKTVFDTLVHDNNGQNHIIANTEALYETYMGRSATTAEQLTWINNFQSDAVLGPIVQTISGWIVAPDLLLGSAQRHAILGSAEGQAHTAAQTTSLYDSLFRSRPLDRRGQRLERADLQRRHVRWAAGHIGAAEFGGQCPTSDRRRGADDRLWDGGGGSVSDALQLRRRSRHRFAQPIGIRRDQPPRRRACAAGDGAGRIDRHAHHPGRDPLHFVRAHHPGRPARERFRVRLRRPHCVGSHRVSFAARLKL